MSLVDGLEDSLNTVSTNNNQIGLKANISDVCNESDLYTKSETNNSLDVKLNSNAISHYFTKNNEAIYSMKNLIHQSSTLK